MRRFLCLLFVFLLCVITALADNPICDEVLCHYSVASEETVTLHIGYMQYNNRLNNILEAAFLTKYPNATIEYQSYTTEQLNLLLLREYEMPDLLLCTSIVMDKLAKQDMLLDIYQTGFIESWPDALIDLSDELEINGSLYGLPIMIEQFYWMWNNDLAEKSNASLPAYPYTWDAYTEMAANLQYDFDGNGVRDMLLFQGRLSSNEDRKNMTDDPFIAYFESKMIDHRELIPGATFHTDEFKHLLDLYTRLLEIRGPWKGVPQFRGEAAYLIGKLGMEGSFYTNYEIESVGLPPTIDAENPGYLGGLYVASIPAKATNPKLALAFCEGMLDAELNAFYSNLDRFFFKTMPKCYVYVPNVELDFFGGSTESVTAETLQPDTWEYYETPITQEEFEMYTFCREHVLPESRIWNQLGNEWEDCLDKYIRGKMTFEALADRLDTALDMIVNE